MFEPKTKDLRLDDLVTDASETHLAVENRDISHLSSIDVKELLKVDCDLETPLHYAVSNNDIEICKLIVERVPTIINMRDIDGLTACDIAQLYVDEYNLSTELVNYLKSVK